MNRSLVSTSKFLSLILRHQPEKIGVELDEQGWIDVEILLQACARSGRNISSLLLQQVVEENDKQRFAFSEDGSRIRANQGHSVEVQLDLPATAPPEELFHGTVARFVNSIRTQGLIKGSRQHVHLSAQQETARKVGSRRGKPVILIVHAGQMHQQGVDFFLSANGVWLTDHVPVEFIRFPPVSEAFSD